MTAPLAGGGSRTPSVWGAYRMRLYQALAVYRFFAFALGVGVYFILDINQNLLLVTSTMVVLVGLANVARVVVPPFYLIRTPAVETALLGAEMVLILALVLATGGLDSPFLIYSLSPILSVSLLSELWATAGLSFLTSVVVVGAHGAAIVGVGTLSGLASGNYMVFAILYATGVALVALLPFLTNVNLERRQRALAAAEERRRIQRDLHDDVAQTLAFLSLKAQRAEQHMEQGRTFLTAQDIRDVARGLRRAYVAIRDFLELPEERLPQSLRDALHEVADSWSQATGIPLEFRVEGSNEPALSTEAQRHLLRIAGEALANASRHAKPSTVWLTLELASDALLMRVRDDGRGISPGQPWGLGLTGMQERAAIMGAALEVRSELGKGTEVIVQLPLPQNKGADS